MTYQSFIPSPSLKEFIRNYTVIHFQFGSGVSVPPKQRATRPEQKIVFYIKGSVSLAELESGKISTPASVSIFTHQLSRKILRVSSEFLALIVFLKPGTLYRLLGFPMTEFTQSYYDAELFFGDEVLLVREQLAEAKSNAALITIVESLLLARLRQIREKASVDMVAASILTDPPSFSLDSMAHDACLSAKQFYRKFTHRIGISPKYFSRLSRFNHAYQFKF